MKAEEFKKKVPIDLEGMVLGKLRVTKGNVEGVVLLDKAGNKTDRKSVV